MKRPAPADLDALHAFVQIVDHGSLSAAGRALGIPKATLSRKLVELEHALGAALLRRTTRAQSLTVAGRTLYERVAPLLNEAERAAIEVRSQAKEPAGLVRISAALGFGQIVLMPILARFLADHPKVRVELELSDARVRVVDAGFDLAIRMGRLDESELLSRRVARIECNVVASPSYLAARGTPKSLEELKSHALLVSDPQRATWRFESDEGTQNIHVRWHMSTGGMTALVDAARLGMGIALIPAYMVDSLIARRELVPVDLGVTPRTAYATALLPRSQTPSSTVRCLLDFMVSEVEQSALLSPRPSRKRRAR